MIIRQPRFFLSQIVQYDVIFKMLYNMICLRFLLTVGANLLFSAHRNGLCPLSPSIIMDPITVQS